MMHLKVFRSAVGALVVLVATAVGAQAAAVMPMDFDLSNDYMIIARMSINGNTDIAANNFELGAMKAPVPSTDNFLDSGSTGGPTLLGAVPLPPANAAAVFEGVGGKGNIALTDSSGEFEFQDVGIYADPAIGIRVATNSNSKNKSSNSFFNDPNMFPNTFNVATQSGLTVHAQGPGGGLFADQSTYIDPTGSGHPSANTGITYGFDHSTLIAELVSLRTIINAELSTGTLDVSGGNSGELETSSTATGATLTFDPTTNSIGGISATLTVGVGVHVIDVVTGSNDFLMNNTNFVIDGPADAFVIFRLPNSDNMLVTNSNIIYGNSGIQNKNIMFYTDQTENDTHYSVSNAILNGIALWSLGPNGGDINVSNSQGCVQFVGDIVDMDDVRYNGCAVSPEPSTFALLSVAAAGLLRRRRRIQSLMEW